MTLTLSIAAIYAVYHFVQEFDFMRSCFLTKDAFLIQFSIQLESPLLFALATHDAKYWIT